MPWGLPFRLGEQVADAKAQLDAEVDRVHQVEYAGDGFVPRSTTTWTARCYVNSSN